MRGPATSALGASLLVLLGFAPCVDAKDGTNASVDRWATKWISILSASESFADAKTEAQKLAKKSGVSFDMEGAVYDKKRGLIYPDDSDDGAYAGQPLLARRYNETLIKDKETEYLSVERSAAYEGFKPGYYIVVAGVYNSKKDAEAQNKRFSPWVPTAYAKKTKLYMGCLH